MQPLRDDLFRRHVVIWDARSVRDAYVARIESKLGEWNAVCLENLQNLRNVAQLQQQRENWMTESERSPMPSVNQPSWNDSQVWICESDTIAGEIHT